MTSQPSIAVPPTTKQPTQGAGPVLHVELVAWALVLVIAASWRLIDLGSALPATAEALRARAAWDFVEGGAFVTQPGDLTSALAAFAIWLGGDALGWARLPGALCGLLSVAALALLRPYLGRAVTLAGALLLASSPLAVAASRTQSPDAAGLLCGLVILALVLSVSERGERRVLPLLAAGCGLALGTGAVAIALMIIAAMHVAIEVAWLDHREVAERWRTQLADRRTLGISALLLLSGLWLALIRFGAGWDGWVLPAFSDFAVPSPDIGAVLPRHAPVTVLLGYEPVVLGLGGIGVAWRVAQWLRHGPASVTVGERLLVEWTAAGLLLSVAALYHRPGHLLVVALPLLFLAADLTLRSLPSLAALRWREGLPALLAATVVLGSMLLRWLHRLNAPSEPSPPALASMVVLLAIAAGLMVWTMLLSPGAVAGLGIAGAWLLAGWIGLHGAAAVTRHSGDEYLFGRRPDPLREAVLRGIDNALAEQREVAVDRRIAAALAWELRGRPVRVFSGLPPRSSFVVVPAGSAMAPGLEPAGITADIERRWYPPGWDRDGILRWLVYRIAWGPAVTLRAETMVSTETVTVPDDAHP